jgi:hypothetical protein
MMMNIDKARELMLAIQKVALTSGRTKTLIPDKLGRLENIVTQIENQRKHFQGLSLRVFQFLDEHYPDACAEFDIVENGGDLE